MATKKAWKCTPIIKDTEVSLVLRHYLSQKSKDSDEWHIVQVTSNRNRQGIFGMPEELARVVIMRGKFHEMFDVMETLEPGYMWTFVAERQLMEEENKFCSGNLQEFDRRLIPASVFDEDGYGILPDGRFDDGYLYWEFA